MSATAARPALPEVHTRVPAILQTWLRDNADRLDTTQELAEQVVPQLAAANLFGVGVPAAFGGSGGDVRDAIEAIADVAQYSLTAAFVFWGHRAFIEFLVNSPNLALQRRWLDPLLKGERGGATGLSNAMKFLSGIESLQITATPQDKGWQLAGALAWITNLRKEGFIAAAGVAPAAGGPPMVVALSSDAAGVVRSPDLDLIALRSSNTAEVRLAAVQIGEADLIHADATQFLPAVRPAFLGMQCGMSIGLARASLQAAHALCTVSNSPLLSRVQAMQADLVDKVAQLHEGVHDGRFKATAAPLFRLRIALAEIVQQAVLLELQASGGAAYLQGQDKHFARRWRESAFIPIITPSLAQLQIALQKQAAAETA
jgi:alkylation response protein AidB-like acyl-CoA dehydrogenase